MDANWGLIGNERAVGALQACVASAANIHAYLLVGPEHTGRALAAKRLAMALNCTGVELPCGACTQCTRIESGIHADVQTVTLDTEAEGAARKSISVEQLREVEKAVALAPYEGRTRVVTVDPAGLMSEAAQHSFLKTLEEPPPHAVFILITANDEKLLETIRSRCTRIEFRLVPAAAIEEALSARGIDPERGRLLARLAGGRPGWAVGAAGDKKLFDRRSQHLERARSLPDMPLPERFDLAGRMSESFKRERDPVLRQLDEWAGWWRDVLLVQSGAADSISNIDETAAINSDAARFVRKDVAQFVQVIVETRGILGENVQSRVALDALMLAVPQPLRASARR